MFIDRIIIFLTEASQAPFLLWSHNYTMARKAFLYDIKQIAKDITDSTAESALTLQKLIALFEQEHPNERSLAEQLVALSDIFHESNSTDQRLTQYQTLAAAFLQRVKKETTLAATRTQMKHSLPVAEQKDFDQRLFAKEGLSYCLLYYITYYKTLTGFETPEDKHQFITQKDINLGFGQLPGIREDFQNDEVLEKFVTRILDDATRTTLTREYFLCKQSVLQATDYVQVEAALHELIYAFLMVFKQHGVTAGSDYFFAPYGTDATIAQLLEQFTPDYAPAR